MNNEVDFNNSAYINILQSISSKSKSDKKKCQPTDYNESDSAANVHNSTSNTESMAVTLSDRNELLNTNISGCIVALGSNFKADSHLKKSITLLETVVLALNSSAKCKAMWSTPFVNPDYTATVAKPKPDYTNQCGYLNFSDGQLKSKPSIVTKQSSNLRDSALIKSLLSSLNNGTSVTLLQFITICKDIELQLNRLQSPNNRSLNANIAKKMLAPHSVSIDIDVLCVEIDNHWHIIKQRYPFKLHEKKGMFELAKI